MIATIREPKTVRAPRAKETASEKFAASTSAPKSLHITAKALRIETPTMAPFNVVRFCDRYQIKRDLISRMTSYAPRTTASWAVGTPPKGAAILKLRELERLVAALEDLVEAKSIGAWLQTPNDAFQGSTPAQLIERGESDRLWRMIHLLKVGQPG